MRRRAFKVTNRSKTRKLKNTVAKRNHNNLIALLPRTIKRQEIHKNRIHLENHTIIQTKSKKLIRAIKVNNYKKTHSLSNPNKLIN